MRDHIPSSKATAHLDVFSGPITPLVLFFFAWVCREFMILSFRAGERIHDLQKLSGKLWR